LNASQARSISGWGRYPRLKAQSLTPDKASHIRECLDGRGELIVHALGRSYGDSALNSRVLLTRRLNHVLDFDPQRGLVECESGVSLAELIEAFLPRGWFLGTTPGTRFVSVGGAIAADVHGKNHHQAGCFSQSVLSFKLMLPSGEVITCSPLENAEIFRATCGGMGLTGVILSARLKLSPLSSAYIDERIIKTRNLEETFAYFQASHEWPYSVAWLDCLARGEDMGRSLLMLGRPARDGGLHLPRKKGLVLPVDLPRWTFNQATVGLFNYLYYHLQRAPVRKRVSHLLDYFYPLDSIGHWNKMYGRRGFTQYQFVIPKEASYQGLRSVLDRISQAGLGSFLVVLKLLGPANDNCLSFPLEGYTLALDFQIQGRLFPLLEELDRVVLDHGGRIYLAKDVRMSRQTFRQGYPRWAEFTALRERLGAGAKLASLQSKRLGV